MATRLMTSPSEINNTTDIDIVELLTDINKILGKQKYYVDELCIYKRKFFKKKKIILYSLLYDCGGFMDMQLMESAGKNKKTILAYLFGLYNGLETNLNQSEKK